MIIIPRRLWYLFNTIIMLYLYQGAVWIVTNVLPHISLVHL